MPEWTNPLRPNETIQKMLISTPSRLVGVFDSGSIAIRHAWPNMGSPAAHFSMAEGPISKCGLVLAFETAPLEKKAGVVIPNYSPTGDRVCAYLSMLFGKRFDCHGLLEGSGFYHIPDFSAFAAAHSPNLWFNSHAERKCFPIPLRLESVAFIGRALTRDADELEIVNRLDSICRHYMQALQNAEHNPEVAYLNLITSGEILSRCFAFSTEELLDKQLLEDLRSITESTGNGAQIAKRLRGQLVRVKKRFVTAISSLLDEEFFAAIETARGYANFGPGDIEDRLSAAYDLRSAYVHSGSPFGTWTQPDSNNEDVQLGEPVVQNRKMRRILEKAPRFSGLERAIRYSTLKFMSSEGFLRVN